MYIYNSIYIRTVFNIKQMEAFCEKFADVYKRGVEKWKFDNDLTGTYKISFLPVLFN